MKKSITIILLMSVMILAVPSFIFGDNELPFACDHVSVASWSSDESNHWHVCKVCGEIADGKKAHSWDAGTTNNGVITYICKVCGYKKNASIQKNEKKPNPLTLKISSKTYKRSSLKKAKSFKIGAVGEGNITYTRNAKSKKAKIKVSNNGKVTIPKKCKKGTYKITVRASGNDKYDAGTKTVTIKVK